MISAAQCRAARALVDWTSGRLAAQAGVPEDDLLLFESGGEIDKTAVEAITRALESAGAHFLPERAPRGAGVRLKFSRQTVKRIDVWENEGGSPADDDIR